MSASLGKLFVVLICDQRQVNIHGNFPAKCLIQSHIFGGRRQILISSHYVSDIHSVVIHNIRKVIGGITVGLDQDHIVQLGILHRDITVKLVGKGSGSLDGIVLPNDKGLAGIQIRPDLLLGQMQAVLVINHDFLAFYNFSL